MRLIDWEKQLEMRRDQEVPHLVENIAVLESTVLDAINSWTLPEGYDRQVGIHPQAIDQAALVLFAQLGESADFASVVATLLARAIPKLQHLFVWAQALDQEEINAATAHQKRHRQRVCDEFATRLKILKLAYAYKTGGYRPPSPQSSCDVPRSVKNSLDYDHNLALAGDYTSLIE